MTVTFTGSSSVADRTIFTHRGPIVKPPVPLLTGANLIVASPDEVYVSTGSFTSSTIGKTITISGSPGGRNDGTFYISAVKGPTRLKLSDVNFDFADFLVSESNLVELTNSIRNSYSSHLVASGVHSSNDTLNIVTAPVAVDVASACIVLNQIKSAISSHSVSLSFHSFADPRPEVWSPDATDLASSIILANELRARYEDHRQNRFFHQIDDFVNRIKLTPVTVTVGTGPSCGPFSWTLNDPRDGQIADDPSDVSVLINSLPATVEAVFGLLGAVVLATKPSPTDTVLIDYRYINNPPTQFERLNSFEFLLNQEGNRGFSGVPGHTYRQRSYTVGSYTPGLLRSQRTPAKIGWKYKGYERRYTACLNDPNSLLLNVPQNRISFPVLEQSVFESVIRYDPFTLPQNSTDPWAYEGTGTLSLTPGGKSLIVKDESQSYGGTPPFFSHSIDLTFDSDVSAAYRYNVDGSEDTLVTEGCFTGVGFGLTDGQKASVIGCIITTATNLTSAISMANSLKSAYGLHLVQTGVHRPNDPSNGVDVVNAKDLQSLIILLNRMKKLYNDHIIKGPASVHLSSDSVNSIILPDAVNLSSAIQLVNVMRNSFNSHRTQSGVHYADDSFNSVGLVKQVGILNSSGFLEEENSWTSFAYDWTVETTYRAYRDSSGNVGLYLSGDMSPRAYVPRNSLPDASNLDLKLDPIHQTFFGSLGDYSNNLSVWRFSRVSVTPINSVQIGGNKSVSYSPVVKPEQDPLHPWVTVGQGGTERVNSSSLILDSTSHVQPSVADSSGLVTGEYRGFLRIEPSLSVKNTLSFEFTTSSSFYSFGVDNRSFGVHISDGTFATQLCFLQSDPTPASVTGTVKEPLPILFDDKAYFTVDNGPLISVVISAPVSSASTLASIINAAAGSTVAFPEPALSPSSIRITSPTLGSGSTIRIISGDIFEKLGIPVGTTYLGKDSSPEPKVSWCGTDLPEFFSPPWSVSGNQPYSMVERTLRITDSSNTGYLSYTSNNPVITSSVIDPVYDWKADFRFGVLSFIPGDSVVSGPNLLFCGSLMNVDEGFSGKNVEVHLSMDAGGFPYVGIYSYNSGTGGLDYISSFPFSWNDGLTHSYSLYTSKSPGDLVLVLVDGFVIGSFPYSSLNIGAYGPSISFGSGSSPVANCDMQTASSVTDWESVCIVRDKKLSDPLSSTRRYIGLYKGGNPELLSSYYLHQLDWTLFHSYRIVRDPTSSVSVYVDGANTPSISAGYDVLTLPLDSLEFLSGIVPSGRFVAFGSFSPFEIVRSQWGDINYSIGYMTVTEGLIPPHQSLNKSNVIASSEHLETKNTHNHYGTMSWSGGTPTDDFMADSTIPAHTMLGEGTPPVPMTQNLESRGGLEQIVTPVESIPSVDLVNERGHISSFENDLENVVNPIPVDTPSATETKILFNTIDLVNAYLAHAGSAVFHIASDVVNVAVPVPFTFAGSLTSLNLLQSNYNAHRSEPGVHKPNVPPISPYDRDILHQSTASAAVDYASAINLIQDLTRSYGSHIVTNRPHTSVSPFLDKLPYYISLANELRDKFNSHRTQAGVHVLDDVGDVVTAPYATDLLSAVALANEIRSRYESHRVYPGFLPKSHVTDDVVNIVTASAALDSTSLYTLLDNLDFVFNAHRVQAGVHVSNDSVNVTAQTVETLVRVLESFRGHFNSHILDSSLHSVPDQSDQVLTPLSFVLNGPLTTADQTVYLKVIEEFRSAALKHFMFEGHRSQDYINENNLSLVPTAVDFATSMSLMNAMWNFFENHVRNQLLAHEPADFTNVFGGTSAKDPLPNAIILANQIRTALTSHVSRKASHVKVKQITSFTPASNLSTLISLVNKLKLAYEDHRESAGVHSIPDAANVVTAVDAFDLESAVLLINNIASAYNAHRVQPGVHANTVVVRLDAPDRVLYEGLRFYTFAEGETGMVSSFSDDETLYLTGSVSQSLLQRLSYPASDFPNRSAIVGLNQEPFPIVDGDIMYISVNGHKPSPVVFQSGDTTVANVVARINGAPGVFAINASDNLDGRVRIVEFTGGVNSFIEVSGVGAQKLGLDSSHATPWVLVSNDISSVSVSVTSMPPPYLRVGTSGSGTAMAYVAKTGLTDQPSMGFRATFRVRITSWAYGPDGDTGIYVGVSGASGPGFTAAVGFVNDLGVKSVVLKDLNSGKRVASRAFDWGDGSFHQYVVVKTEEGSVSLEVIP